MKKNLPEKYYHLLCTGMLIFLSSFSQITGNSAESHAYNDILKTTVTINCTNCSMKEVLHYLEESTEIKFIFSTGNVKGISFPNLAYVNTPLGEVLAALLNPYELTYTVMNNRIIIKADRQPGTGTIRGKVFDSQNKDEFLIGASVRVEGTNLGAPVNIDGVFEITHIPVGTYSLLVSYVSYQARRIEDIQVTENIVTVVNVPLDQQMKKLDEIVVTADFPVEYVPIKNSTEMTLLSSIRAETGIVTGISHQQISRSLDRNAADVAQRIPGITLLNNFVLIRGLDPRYTMTFLNGMIAPSTEENQRAFSFNLVPSGLLDQMMVYKSPAPELPGQFAGGIVKVSTKQANTARRIQIGISGQYRTGGSSFTDTYSNTGTSDSDWIGFGLGDRLYDERLYNADFQFPDKQFFPSANAELTRNFPEPYSLRRSTHNFDKRFNINYYDSWKIGGSRLNNLTSATYTNEASFRRIDAIQDLRATRAGDTYIVEPIPEAQFVDSVYDAGLRLSVLENLNYLINDHHEIGFTGFFNRQVLDQTIVRDGFREQTLLNTIRRIHFEYSRRDLFSGQLTGNHLLGKHHVQWYAGRTWMKESIPDLQSYEFYNVDSAKTEGTYIIRSRLIDRNTRRGGFFMEENGIMAGVDHDYTFSNGLKLKTGGMMQVQDRLFESWYYSTYYAGNLDLQRISEPWFNMSGIYNDSLVTNDQSGLFLMRDYSEGRYSVDYQLYSGYVGFELPVWNNRIQLNAGVRYEWTERKLFDNLDRLVITEGGFDNNREGVPVGDTIAGPVFDYWLPSASINWNITSGMKLRATYGKTLDRPAFREIANFSFLEFEERIIYTGNPGLVDAEIQNYDLRWEWYPTSEEFVAVGFFYKNLTNAIELADVTNLSALSGSGNSQMVFINTEEAYVRGFEIEVRRHLGFIPWRPLRYFSIIGNYAYMQNRVDLGEEFEEEADQPEIGNYRPFVGASPYVANVALYFEQPEWGTTISALVNSIGQRMISTGMVRQGPIYQRERTTLDLTWSQRITPFLSLKVGVQDLLNQPFEFYRDDNLDGKYTPGQVLNVTYDRSEREEQVVDFMDRRFRLGSYYSVGLSVEF